MNVIRARWRLHFPRSMKVSVCLILEAMLCETPVITSNFGSMREIAGEAGILVYPYDVREIKEAMIAWEGQVARGSVGANQFSTEAYRRRSWGSLPSSSKSATWR